MVRSYLNKFSMSGAVEIPIKLHPEHAGRARCCSSRRRCPIRSPTCPTRCRSGRGSEYYQIEWPLRARRYEYGVYADEVLQNYAPFAFGAITNIGNG